MAEETTKGVDGGRGKDGREFLGMGRVTTAREVMMRPGHGQGKDKQEREMVNE